MVLFLVLQKNTYEKTYAFQPCRFILCSCQFNEKLVLNENGSGNYTYSFDIDAASMLKGLDTSTTEKQESTEKSKVTTLHRKNISSLC